jgi:hypothetical protein
VRSLLIIDHTLQSYDGHSYNYDMALARVATRVFNQVDVYADKHFTPQSDTSIIPALTNHSAWAVRLAKRCLARLSELRSGSEATPCHQAVAVNETCQAPSVLFRTQRYLRALESVRAWEALLSSDRYSQVTDLDIFVQHACTAELVATELLARRWKRKDKNLTVHLVVRHSPERTCSLFESMDSLKCRLERLCALRNPRVCLYTDSGLLSEAFRRLTPDSGQFKVLPIPVDFTSARSRRRKERIRLGFLGSPRLEKGFGLIPSVLDVLPPSIGARALELAVQTLPHSEEPEVRRVTRWLETLVPQPNRIPLLIWRGPATSDIYYEWFSSTDILLGLYTSPKYIASTSGVFVEALHCGVPTITFARTWVADQIRHAAERELWIGETIHTVQELPAKVAQIVREIDRYQQDTLTYLGFWRQFHTPERMVSMLCNADRELPAV